MSSGQKLRNVFNRAYKVLDLLYPSTATEYSRITQARELLVGVVEDLQSLAGEADWKEKKLAEEELRNALQVLARLDKAYWTIDQAFVVAVIRGQHDDRIGHYVVKDIEDVCLGHDRASLTFTDFEECLATANPATEEEDAGLFELKEMVRKARAGTTIPIDWTWSHIANRGSIVGQ